MKINLPLVSCALPLWHTDVSRWIMHLYFLCIQTTGHVEGNHRVPTLGSFKDLQKHHSTIFSAVSKIKERRAMGVLTSWIVAWVSSIDLVHSCNKYWCVMPQVPMRLRTIRRQHRHSCYLTTHYIEMKALLTLPRSAVLLRTFLSRTVSCTEVYTIIPGQR